MYQVTHNLPGVIAKSTKRFLLQEPQRTNSTAADDESNSDVQILDDEPEPEPVKVLEATSSFKEIVVWGHDQIPANDDAFVKGVAEWIAFANALHGSHRPQP